MTNVAASTLYRVAAVAGIGGAVVLVVNAAKRAALIPASTATQLVAPLAEVLGLALVTGLFFAASRRTGAWGLVAYLLNSLALASLIGAEFVINLVFSQVSPELRGDLLAGPLGLGLTIASGLFLLGSLAFAASLIVAREVPVGAVALYSIGAIPVALRAFVPELVLDLGLVVLAAGIGWLSIWLLGRARTLGDAAASTSQPADSVIR